MLNFVTCMHYSWLKIRKMHIFSSKRQYLIFIVSTQCSTRLDSKEINGEKLEMAPFKIYCMNVLDSHLRPAEAFCLSSRSKNLLFVINVYISIWIGVKRCHLCTIN